VRAGGGVAVLPAHFTLCPQHDRGERLATQFPETAMKQRPLTAIELRQERDNFMRRLADLPLTSRRKPVRVATAMTESAAAILATTSKRKLRKTEAVN
jgi:hypothetical protein